MSLNGIERAQVQAAVNAMVDHRQPPPELQDKLRIEMEFDGHRVRVRPLGSQFMTSSKTTRSAVAPSTYVRTRDPRTLSWTRRDGKWHQLAPRGEHGPSPPPPPGRRRGPGGCVLEATTSQTVARPAEPADAAVDRWEVQLQQIDHSDPPFPLLTAVVIPLRFDRGKALIAAANVQNDPHHLDRVCLSAMTDDGSVIEPIQEALNDLIGIGALVIGTFQDGGFPAAPDPARRRARARPPPRPTRDCTGCPTTPTAPMRSSRSPRASGSRGTATSSGRGSGPPPPTSALPLAPSPRP